MVGGVVIASRSVAVACRYVYRGRYDQWVSGRGGVGTAVGTPLLVCGSIVRNSHCVGGMTIVGTVVFDTSFVYMAGYYGVVSYPHPPIPVH